MISGWVVYCYEIDDARMVGPIFFLPFVVYSWEPYIFNFPSSKQQQQLAEVDLESQRKKTKMERAIDDRMEEYGNLVFDYGAVPSHTHPEIRIYTHPLCLLHHKVEIFGWLLRWVLHINTKNIKQKSKLCTSTHSVVTLIVFLSPPPSVSPSLALGFSFFLHPCSWLYREIPKGGVGVMVGPLLAEENLPPFSIQSYPPPFGWW